MTTMIQDGLLMKLAIILKEVHNYFDWLVLWSKIQLFQSSAPIAHITTHQLEDALPLGLFINKDVFEL